MADEIGIRSLFARDIFVAAQESQRGDSTARVELRAFRDFAERCVGPLGQRAQALDLADDEYLGLRKSFSLQGFPEPMRRVAMAYPGLIPTVSLPAGRGLGAYLDDLTLEDFSPSVFLGETCDKRKFIGFKVRCEVDFLNRDFRSSNSYMFFLHQRYADNSDTVVGTGNSRDYGNRYLGPEGSGTAVNQRTTVHLGQENYLWGLDKLFREGEFTYRTNHQADRSVYWRLI